MTGTPSSRLPVEPGRSTSSTGCRGVGTRSWPAASPIGADLSGGDEWRAQGLGPVIAEPAELAAVGASQEVVQEHHRGVAAHGERGQERACRLPQRPPVGGTVTALPAAGEPGGAGRSCPR